MIFDHERLRHGFWDSNTLVAADHPGAKTESPTPNPAGVIGELEITDDGNPVSHGQTQLAGQQRPLSFPLLHNMPAELVAAPRRLVFAGREVSVEHHDLDSDRIRKRGGDENVAPRVHQKDFERVAVFAGDLAAGEDWERRLWVENKSQARWLQRLDS